MMSRGRRWPLQTCGRAAERARTDYRPWLSTGRSFAPTCGSWRAVLSDITIDFGGRDTDSLRAALTVAKVVLIAVKPRIFDLWGFDQTADLVTEARKVNERLRAIVVLNEADAQRRHNQQATDSLRDIERLEIAPLLIGWRRAFSKSRVSCQCRLNLSLFHRSKMSLN
jgi:hypothetical protein